MTLNEYQEAAAKFRSHPGFAYLIPALCAEAGEVAAVYAKRLRATGDEGFTPTTDTKDRLADELGDVPWLVAEIAALCAEAGEVAAVYAKRLRATGDEGFTPTTETKDRLADELGDVLWLVAEIADLAGFDLSSIAERNIGKLADRASRTGR